MRYFFPVIFTSFFLFSGLSLFPQGMHEVSNVDSMLHLLESSGEDSNKVILLEEIAYYYATKDLEKAMEFAEQGLFLAKQIKYRRGEGVSLVQVGNINNDLGKVSSALNNFEQAAGIAHEINDKKLLMSALNNLGISYFNLAEFEKALDYYLQNTRLAEELNDEKVLPRAYNNVANVYIRIRNDAKALEYHFKGLKISEKLGDKMLIAGSYNNIGIVYRQMGQKEKALEYYLKTLKLAEELNHKLGMTFALNNIGTLYAENNEPGKALEYIQRALILKREIGEKKGIANTLNNAGICYNDLQRYDEALKAYYESVEIAKEIDEKNSLISAYEGLRDVFEAKKDYKKAYEYFRLYSAVKDTIFNKEKSEQVAEMQTRFETEKKEKELKLQSVEIENKDALMKQQKYRQYVLMAGMMLILVLAVAIYIAFRQKQRNNKMLTVQNEKIRQQNRIIEKAHSILENKSKDITESILYARRIQQAILPQEDEIKMVFPNSFVFFRPKDVVSGDFYWFSQVNGLYILAVADSTGHGVPGAFMSMIGNDMLNQVVNDGSVSNPAEALELMDTKIGKALSKGRNSSEMKEGIEMAMVAFDRGFGSLHFSGAGRPLFVLRKGEILEYKPTNQTLGIFSACREPFRLHTIPLEKNDIVYLFTDGFSDQFGGPRNKKFLTKRFRELLLLIASKPMDEQKMAIENTFEGWKGKQKQVDDICIVGIKI